MAASDPISLALAEQHILSVIMDQLPYVDLCRAVAVDTSWRSVGAYLRDKRRAVRAEDVARGQHVAVTRRLLAVAPPGAVLSLAAGMYGLDGDRERESVSAGYVERVGSNGASAAPSTIGAPGGETWVAGKGPLLLARAVTMVGARAPADDDESTSSGTIIRAHGKFYPVQVQAAGAVLQALTITSAVGLDDMSKFSVRVNSGSVALARCDVSGTMMINHGASATVNDSRIHDSETIGVSVWGALSMFDSTVERCGCTGVTVSEGEATLRRCKVLDNGTDGIAVYGRATLSDVVVERNARRGVFVNVLNEGSEGESVGLVTVEGLLGAHGNERGDYCVGAGGSFVGVPEANLE